MIIRTEKLADVFARVSHWPDWAEKKTRGMNATAVIETVTNCKGQLLEIRTIKATK